MFCENHITVLFDVFCAFMEDEVGGNFKCTSDVIVNGDGFGEMKVEVMKKKFEPNNLTSNVGKGVVFRFRR